MQALESNAGLKPRSPEVIINDKLSLQWQSGVFENPETQERRKSFYFGLWLGWNALAHERYGLLSAEASGSAFALMGYARENGRRTVQLTPRQMKTLEACAEVANIHFKPEASGIPIPEAALNYNRILLERATTAKR